MIYFNVYLGDELVFKSPIACVDDCVSIVVELARYFKVSLDSLWCEFENLGDED